MAGQTQGVATRGSSINVGKQLAEVKLSDIIRDMGKGIAQAQFELDKTSLRIAQMMSGTEYETDEMELNDDGTPKLEGGKPVMIIKPPNLVNFNGQKYSMLELGFTPSFYQFVDTIMEVKISISMTMSESASEGSSTVKAAGAVAWSPFAAGSAMTATTVNASYASKYQYSAEGSSLIRTKLVPVPPPAILEERIRRIMDANPIER